MNHIDIGDIGQKCKKIVQYLWDPEPRNEDPECPVWCLGEEYRSPAPDPGQQMHGMQACSSSFSSAAPPEHHQQSQRHQPDNRSIPSYQDSEYSFVDDGKGLSSSTASSATYQSSSHDWPPSFLDDFESKFWLTYRSNFPPIPRAADGHDDAAASRTLGVRLRMQLSNANGFTTDTGWGCMIRSGQSLLATALSFLTLGRDWRRGTKVKEESKLLSLFADDPRAPFSIHRFVQHGAVSCGKYPGEWFGPSATARCIQALSAECQHAGLNVYVSNDGADVYEDRFRDISSGCGSSSSDKGVQEAPIRPTLILLGVRLGIDHVTPVYWEALKAALQYPQSVGIAGGRPSSSHYFIGVQGEYFFYLDPHHTRPAFPYDAWKTTLETDKLNTYHTRRLRRIHVREMDPSMLIGFLIRDEEDWRNWKERVRSGAFKPIIHIFDQEPSAYARGREREAALDEVETLEDDDE
ncbi:hypothetical protein VTO42DRAFT_4343 [Malbranchea cinnamomea]